MEFTPQLKADYTKLWSTMVISPVGQSLIKGKVAMLVANKIRYQAMEKLTGVPWYLIATIHMMEGGGSFAKHLYNGDPLTARTVQVPAGQPKTGTPPFTWEESAHGALSFKGLDKVTDWSIERCLYVLESYNGWGYRNNHPQVKSPYLWSFTNQYKAGKFIADHVFSATAVSKQMGAACYLKSLYEEKKA